MISFNFEDLHASALTLIGEARGEPLDGQVAVAEVIKNRTKDLRWPSTPSEVVWQDKQFSVWNNTQGNLNNLIVMAVGMWKDEEYRRMLAICAAVFQGLLPERTEGANHYHSVSVSPEWHEAGKVTTKIGNHVFLRL